RVSAARRRRRWSPACSRSWCSTRSSRWCSMSSASDGRADEAMIEVEDLTIGYGERVVLEKLDFAVPSGQVFAILGGSGCGKSTLLRHLIGLEAPMAGRIR